MWNDDEADVGGFVGVFMLAILVVLFRHVLPMLVKVTIFTIQQAIEIAGLLWRKYKASRQPPALPPI